MQELKHRGELPASESKKVFVRRQSAFSAQSIKVPEPLLPPDFIFAIGQNLSSAAPRLTSNDWLRLGSTFHSLHAIASQVGNVAERCPQQPAFSVFFVWAI